LAGARKSFFRLPLLFSPVRCRLFFFFSDISPRSPFCQFVPAPSWRRLLARQLPRQNGRTFSFPLNHTLLICPIRTIRFQSGILSSGPNFLTLGSDTSVFLPPPPLLRCFRFIQTIFIPPYPAPTAPPRASLPLLAPACATSFSFFSCGGRISALTQFCPSPSTGLISLPYSSRAPAKRLFEALSPDRLYTRL